MNIKPSSRHLVDPELLPVLDVFPKFDFTPESLAEIREDFRQMMEAEPPPPENGVKREERRLPGPVGAPLVRALIYTPPGGVRPRPALLHIHGGGYVIGSPEMNHARNYLLSAELDCVIVSVDYRLPPEHPFPAPLEDCYAALKWLHDNASSLGVDATRIVIGGESAGGGLTAALALLARDRGEVPVAFQWLIYPMLDDRTCVREISPVIGEFLWTRENNHFGWTSMLGQAPGAQDVSPYASAARAENLAGLPPAFVGVGALDLFVDEDIIYAQRLLQAGVPTELHVYPGAYHGIDVSTPDSKVARQFRADMVSALRKAWGNFSSNTPARSTTPV